MVFRIEDTDAARDSEESFRQLVDALTWLKIDWDEGVEVGDPTLRIGQSERHDIYREVIDKLIATGALYESYSTAEEIDARNEAAGRAKRSATTTSTATSPTSRRRRSAPRAASPPCACACRTRTSPTSTSSAARSRSPRVRSPTSWSCGRTACRCTRS